MTIKEITKNKKAFFDYEIIQTYEAGLKLFWHEVKSIRSGYVNLKWSYISFVGWHALAKGIHITPWKALPNSQSIDGKRDINLFLHKKDIAYLVDRQKVGWFAIIPLELYFKWSLIKLKVALAKWRKEYDKKQVLKERSLDKEAKMYLKKFI